MINETKASGRRGKGKLKLTFENIVSKIFYEGHVKSIRMYVCIYVPEQSINLVVNIINILSNRTFINFNKFKIYFIYNFKMSINLS